MSLNEWKHNNNNGVGEDSLEEQQHPGRESSMDSQKDRKKKTMVMGKIATIKTTGGGGGQGDPQSTIVLQKIDASKMFGWTKQSSTIQGGFASSGNFTKTYHDTYHQTNDTAAM